jgi:hypothetical protein
MAKRRIVDGIRKQFWFNSERDAKQAAKDRNDELIAHGSQVAFIPVKPHAADQRCGATRPSPGGGRRSRLPTKGGGQLRLGSPEV